MTSHDEAMVVVFVDFEDPSYEAFERRLLRLLSNSFAQSPSPGPPKQANVALRALELYTVGVFELRDDDSRLLRTFVESLQRIPVPSPLSSPPLPP